MFDAFSRSGKTQKCSIRHAEPGYVKASRKASRTLLLNLRKLKEVADPIRVSLSNRPDENEVLRNVGRQAEKIVSEKIESSSGKISVEKRVQSLSDTSSSDDYRPPRPIDLD